MDIEPELNKTPTIAPTDTEIKPVQVYFDLESTGWNDIYHKQDVYSVIHQDRRFTALSFFDELCLPRDARILEIGCGAGLTTVDIAGRGYCVTAVDSSKAMVELARQNAERFGVGDRVTFGQWDIYHLPFEEGSFDMVIALGVIPWLPDLQMAMQAIRRQVRGGGFVLMNIDNRYRLNHLLNPMKNPLLARLKTEIKNRAVRLGYKASSTPPVQMYSVDEFEKILRKHGFQILKDRMLGFGPFQFFYLDLFNDRVGVKVYRYLQSLADQGNPLLRRVGAQYLVLAESRSRPMEIK